jgi:hypothetical protein
MKQFSRDPRYIASILRMTHYSCLLALIGVAIKGAFLAVAHDHHDRGGGGMIIIIMMMIMAAVLVPSKTDGYC